MATLTFRPTSFSTNTYTSTSSTNCMWDGNLNTNGNLYENNASSGYAITAFFSYSVPTGAVVSNVSMYVNGRVTRAGGTTVYAYRTSTSYQIGSSSLPLSISTITLFSSSSSTVINANSYAVKFETDRSEYDTDCHTYVYEIWLEVTYTIPTYAITANAGAGGSISPSGSTSVTQGNSQTYTITPDEGYLIADVAVDGASVGAVSSYTFTNVTAAHTIAASFAVAFDKTAMFLRRRERWL